MIVISSTLFKIMMTCFKTLETIKSIEHIKCLILGSYWLDFQKDSFPSAPLSSEDPQDTPGLGRG